MPFLIALMMLSLALPVLAQDSPRFERAQLAARAAELKAGISSGQTELLQATATESKRQGEVSARERELAKAVQSGSDVTKAQKDLEYSQDWLTLASQVKDGEAKQLKALRAEQAENEMGSLWVDIDEKLRASGVQSAEAEALRAKLDQLAQQLVKLEAERKAAADSARVAEAHAQQLETLMDRKWNGLGQGRALPVRRTRRSEVWGVTEPGGSEVDGR